jgi:hypothetical protein
MFEKVAISEVPTLVTAVIIITVRPAVNRAYSIAVTPELFLRKRRISSPMGWPPVVVGTLPIKMLVILYC